MARRGRAAFVFAVASLLIVGCQPPARRDAFSPAPRDAAAASARAPIRVGAWNIEWLGTPGSRSGPAKNVAQTAEDLADYILAADVAILGVEEIARSGSGDGWTNDTLSQALEIIGRRTGHAWRQRLFPARSGRNQNTGIAWDTTRVTAVGEPRPATLADRAADGKTHIWARPPFGQTFSAGDGLTDFVVFVLHMKSDYGGSFEATRELEARAFVRDLPGTFTDRDTLLIGDANCSRHSEAAVAVFESAGLADLNAADSPTHWRYGPLDRALVPAAQPEFSRRVFEVRKKDFLASRGLSDEQFKVRYSDHWMIVTEIDVMPDDD